MSKKDAPENVSEMSPSPRPVKKYRITIHNQEGPGGKDDVPVGVNGDVWQIKREHEVEVPEMVFDVLKNAVEDRYHMDASDNIVRSSSTRFPISSSLVA
jgi:hypothetical protein